MPALTLRTSVVRAAMPHLHALPARVLSDLENTKLGRAARDALRQRSCACMQSVAAGRTCPQRRLASKPRQVLFNNTQSSYERNTLVCMQPYYCYLDVPYYGAGLKAYGLVANWSNLAMSRFLGAAESRRRFSTLAAVRSDGVTRKGTVRFVTLCSL